MDTNLQLFTLHCKLNMYAGAILSPPPSPPPPPSHIHTHLLQLVKGRKLLAATFLVPGVLLKSYVAKVKDSCHHSEDVCLLFSRQTNLVHGVLENFELFGIVYCRIRTGGRVQVLQEKCDFDKNILRHQECTVKRLSIVIGNQDSTLNIEYVQHLLHQLLLTTISIDYTKNA